jgi:hypothetical protein
MRYQQYQGLAGQKRAVFALTPLRYAALLSRYSIRASAMPISECFQLPRVPFRKTSVLDRVNAQLAGFSSNHLT